MYFQLCKAEEWHFVRISLTFTKYFRKIHSLLHQLEKSSASTYKEAAGGYKLLFLDNVN